MKKKATNPTQYSAYLSPKYWLLWFTVGLLRLSVFLPLTITHSFGTILGKLFYYLAPSRRHAAQVNIKQAFPHYTQKEINALNKKSFKSLGISFFEMGAAWFASDNTLKKRCQIEGIEHLNKAIADNKPIILLTGHFTTLEIGSRLISFYCDNFSGVYKKARNPLFNKIMVRGRSKYCKGGLVENKNVRAIIRGLKAGNPTWFAPDQDFKRQDIVFTPFLGGTASTLTATARFSKIANAVVIPFYPVRIKNNGGFKLIIKPALTNFPTDDIEIDSARVNKTIEEMVYKHPEQYLWLHKRFKNQPNGYSNIYAKIKQ